MQKLHLALDVYRGLGVMSATRGDTLAKVTSMLLHPFPKVCVSVKAAEYRTDGGIGSHYGCRDVVVLDA
jgi:hypothetical protein